MKNLLYKEFQLVVHPLFFLVPLFGALLLIPQWLYFIAVMYFLFITVPNIFTMAKAQNDIGFSALLPVPRSDIVKARVMSIVVLELLQIVVTTIFAFINMRLYPAGNFMLDANMAFIGFTFVLYGVYNVILFPMFYKTAYKIGGPVIIAMVAVVLFASAVEFLAALAPFSDALNGNVTTPIHLAVLAGGIALFALLSVAAYKISVKRFERVDI